MADCIFCALVKQNPQNKLMENDSFVAFLDLNPVSSGHTIIVPKNHIESYFNLTDVDAVRLQKMEHDLKRLLSEKAKPDGFNIGVNDGEVAGATQKHLIIHFIPRYKGDVANPAGGIRNILGFAEAPKKEEPRPEPKPEPKPEPVKEKPKEPAKPKTWQDLLEENKKRKKDYEFTQVRNKFK